MNAHVSISDLSTVNMTSKGQVLIPKTLRDRIGLVPGGPVQVGLNDRGEIVIAPAGRKETADQRRRHMRAGLEHARGSGDFGGLSTDAFMATIRGPYAGEM